MTRVAAVALATSVVLCPRSAPAQTIPIGTIDFYGLRTISVAEARAALTFEEGASIAFDAELPPFLDESEKRLAALPGVTRTDKAVICCFNDRVIVFFGVEERGAPMLQFHEAPRGPERLAADVLAAGRRFGEVNFAAVQVRATDDRSAGHAMSSYVPLHAIEEEFLRFARRDPAALRAVLRSSSDAEHRAIAATVLGYAVDKRAVVGDFVEATRDPDETVRNNATRSLAMFAAMTDGPVKPRIPTEPFVAMLNSLVWTDRNKASAVLDGLSATRDPALLMQLRRDALPALVEMARWKSTEHASPALRMLGRLAGLSEEAIVRAVSSNDRENLINAALATVR